MENMKTLIKINNKEFPGRVHVGSKPKYLFVTHHGLLSNNTSFRYFEKWIGENGIVVNYDMRVNGENKMRASRMASTYIKDLRDVIRWAKKEYPDIPVVTIGSSIGASVVIGYAKKYGTNEVYKNVAWSIPYNFISGEEANEQIDKTKKEAKQLEEVGFKEPTKLTWANKFFWMILFNLNTKAYAKIDLDRTANNKTLSRLNKMNKPKATPVKLFYASGKLIWTSNKKINKINKRSENEFLYFQSTIDSYLTKKKLEQLKKITGKGVNAIFLDKGKHAFQWETENNLNERVFQKVLDWLNK